MLKNYLLTALRNFRTHRFYTVVNIIGLSIGLTCTLVVYSILKHELTFDNWHPKVDRIYRVVEHYQADWGMSYDGVLPNAMPLALQEEAGNQFDAIMTLHGPESATFEFYLDGQYRVFEERGSVAYANSDFLKHMDFPIIQGAGPEALDEPFNVYLTQKIATKYFGDKNPVGETLKMNEFHQVTIVGIMEDVPTNTNAPFDVLVSYPTVVDINGDYLKSWTSYWSATTYVKLSEGEDFAQKEGIINEVADAHFEEERKERTQYFLQPITDIHTETKYDDGVNYVAPSEVLIGFILLASITLIASILNFINLSTAQAVKRSKEIGIRKTLGSSRTQLVVQFLSETFLLVVVSTLLAFTIGQFFISKMNEFLTIVAFEIGYDFSSIVFAFILSLLVTILAGFYPSVILSGYNPIGALHNQITISKGSGKVSLRKSLVIAQFVIANLLIICTIIVSAQMSYVKNKDLGFNPGNVITLNIPSIQKDKLSLINNDLRELSFVRSTSIQFSPPQADYNWNTGYQVSDISTNDRLNTNLKFVDSNYLDLYEIELIAGRNLENKHLSDSTQQVLVSRELLNRVDLKPEEAIGQSIQYMGRWKATIIGVVEDFNNWSLTSKLGPVLMMYNPEQMSQIAIKTDGQGLNGQLIQIEDIFRNHISEGFFSAKVLSDSIAESYLVENLVYGVFQIFAGMAILIALMGLYGLVSFMAIQKRKAISIRKVFGASSVSILRMFGFEYILLMIVAFVIAAPLSYLLSDEWLNGFYYRIPISYGYFVVSFACILIITMFTVITKSYQTASANPIDSLRQE